MTLSAQVKLLSLAVHVQEWLDTGEALDLEAVKALAFDDEVLATIANFDQALLPVKRPPGQEGEQV